MSEQNNPAIGSIGMTPIKSYGGQGRYCIIRDPAGAFAARFEPAKQS